MRTTLVVVLVGAVLLGGCSDSPEEVRDDYCDAVEEHQPELTEIMAEESATTLLRALPVFRELAAAAPRDIVDDWSRVTDALAALETALDEAGVDPATYDATQPPAGVTDEQQRAIAHAADGVARPQVADSLDAVQQQARDVCGTPLFR